jgi:hypothetical protein
MDEGKVSTQGCRYYNHGLVCYRAAKSPGCPYVHNNDARKEAMEKKKSIDLKKKKDRKLAASRAKLQEKYNKDLASKTPDVPNTNKAKQVSKSTNTAIINSKIEAIINQANADIQCSTVATLNSGIIDSMVSKTNNLQLHNVTVRPFETVYQLTWATVIYSKPIAQLAQKQKELLKAQRKVCKYFRAGSCWKGDRCNMSHDQSSWSAAAPKATEAASVAVEQPKSLVTYATTASQGIAIAPKVVPPKVEQPKVIITSTAPPAVEQAQTIIAAPALPTNQDLINFNKKSWDTSDTLHNWACQNLRMTTATKFLVPYIMAGKIPKSVLFGSSDKASDKEVFQYFELLPAELRIQIWKYAMKNYVGKARVVWKWDDYHMGNYYHSRLESKNPPPPFLHVNKETRSLATGHYDLTFATMQSGPETFFNYEQDILFLQTAFASQILPMVKLFHDHERNLIQQLTVPLRDFIHNERGFIDAITRFRDLKCLKLAVADTREDEYWARNPRMAKKVTRAIEALWIRRHRNAPTTVPLPTVEMMLLDGIVAKFYGIDGITWGGSVEREYGTVEAKRF